MTSGNVTSVAGLTDARDWINAEMCRHSTVLSKYPLHSVLSDLSIADFAFILYRSVFLVFFFGHPLFTYAQIKDNFPPYNVFHQKSLLKIHVKSFKSQYAQFFYFWKILFLSVTSVGISVGWLQRSPDRTGKKREKFKVDRVIFLGVGAHSFKA